MDFKTLNFTIFCIGSVAEYLKMNARDVYHLMQDASIITDYIVPGYDVLHTFSKEYIVEDLVEFMKRKSRHLTNCVSRNPTTNCVSLPRHS